MPGGRWPQTAAPKRRAAPRTGTGRRPEGTRVCFVLGKLLVVLVMRQLAGCILLLPVVSAAACTQAGMWSDMIWLVAFLIVYVVWCATCIIFSFCKLFMNGDWRRMTIKNTILISIIVYCGMRGLYYSLYAAGDCLLDNIPVTIYYILVDAPEFFFLLIFTQLVVNGPLALSAGTPLRS